MSISIPPRPAPLVQPPYKAGPIGQGAGVLQTEFPLSSFGKPSPQKKMKRAWDLSFAVPWIAAAEDAIGERFSGIAWALEDETDATIDDTYGSPDAQKARQLLEYPSRTLEVGSPYYRSDLWALTCRAMGVCGSAFIFLDQPEALGDTPAAMLPIAPWRLFPQDDEKGNLIGWWIDKTDTSPGIAVKTTQVLHFMLRRSFEGHFGIGLMESAAKKAGISQGLDDHAGLVLSAGGRLSGIISPKEGVVPDETMRQMELDWRTVVEQSDAAKRLQLVRAPINFDRTTLTPAELQIRNMMDGARDDLLALWGVPPTIIGVPAPAGLNSGDVRKYDEAAIWQGPVHHRLGIFREVLQYQLLDRWQALGSTIELELDEPEFDDDSPRYDLLGKSLSIPMRTSERRALIGLDPFGDPALDDAIVLPSTIIPYAQAPNPDETMAPRVVAEALPEQASTPTDAASAAGETTGKATIHPRVAPLHASLTRFRANLTEKTVPRIRTAVGTVLQEQRSDIAKRLRKHAEQITKRPADTSVWFDRGWDAKLRAALAPHLTVMAESVVAHVQDVLPSKKAGPVGAVDRVLERGAARVTGINDTTRQRIQDAIVRGLDEGLSVNDVADEIEGIDGLGLLFDEARAEVIARTELMDAYNGAALGSYSDAGLTQVQAIDGDGDEECAARDGEVFDIDEADTIEDHPNGTLDWIPVLDEGKASRTAPAPTPMPVINLNISEGAFKSELHADISPSRPPMTTKIARNEDGSYTTTEVPTWPS